MKTRHWPLVILMVLVMLPTVGQSPAAAQLTPLDTITTVTIAQSSDDAGPIYYNDCNYSTSFPEIYFGRCNNGQDITSGFRFANVHVPQYAEIIDAHIEFTVDGPYDNDITVTFYGEASGNAETFSDTNRPEDRPLMSSLGARWHISSSDEWQTGEQRSSPPLTDIVQTLVDRSDWATGNALAIIVKNSGDPVGTPWHRRVFAYDRLSPAQLKITFKDVHGCRATPTPLPTYAGTPPANGNVQRQIASCVDDANVQIGLNESDYYWDVVRMGAHDAAGGAPTVQYADGWLFRDVRIPQGANISSARLRLYPTYQTGTPIPVEIAGDDRGQSDDFSSNNQLVYLRPRTQARVSWTITNTAHGWTDSPDIAPIIAEIVGRDDWRAGNNLSIIISPQTDCHQYLNWYAYEGSTGLSAKLFVSYAMPTTDTPTATPTGTPTKTATPTPTGTPTFTQTPTPTVTPTPTFTPTPTPTGTPTATPTIALGNISGTVWLDRDGNGEQDGDEPGLIDITIVLLFNRIQIGQTQTQSNGAYSFTMLPSGDYQVRETQPSWLRYSSTPDEIQLSVAEGEYATINFGDWSGLPNWLPLLPSQK